MRLKQIVRGFEQKVQLLLEGSFDKLASPTFKQLEGSDPMADSGVDTSEPSTSPNSSPSEPSVETTRELKDYQDRHRWPTNDLPETIFILDGRQHVSFRKAVIRIGRHLDNDIVLDLPEISRFHGQVSWRNGRALLHDLSSSGGIYLNGERINTALLYNGDVIRIGSHSIVFGTEEEVPKPPIRTTGESPTSILKSARGE